MIRVLFVRHTSIASLAIRLFTFSRWSHVALLTDVGTAIDATAFLGVRERPVSALLTGASKYEVLIVSTLPPQQAIEAARSQIGKKYDWAAVFGLYFRSGWQNPKRWFCSELVAWCLNRSGEQVFREEGVSRITPEHLWLLQPRG